MNWRKLLGVGSLATILSLSTVSSALASDTITVVKPGDLATSLADVVTTPTSWFYYNDETDTIDNTLGSYVSGPSTPPLGSESVMISVTGTQRRNLATYQFSGTVLSDITSLGFSTYNPSAGNSGSSSRSAYLNFNVDFDGSDTWQKRLAYVPSQNGTVIPDTWQAWDAIDGGNALWSYSGATWPATTVGPDANLTEPGSTLRSWSDILADYPGVRVRVTDSWMGLRVGEPYADGYTENLDAFVFGTSGNKTTFDFDLVDEPLSPTNKDECKNDGWKNFTNPTFANQGQCIKYVEHNNDHKGEDKERNDGDKNSHHDDNHKSDKKRSDHHTENDQHHEDHDKGHRDAR